jgi:hypothetical protein
MKTFQKFKEDALNKPPSVEEDEGGAPTNNISSGNIAGVGDPGVPVRKKLQIVNGPPVDPRMFADKIFTRNPPEK